MLVQRAKYIQNLLLKTLASLVAPIPKWVVVSYKVLGSNLGKTYSFYLHYTQKKSQVSGCLLDKSDIYNRTWMNEIF